jgi:hypothetical protein
MQLYKMATKPEIDVTFQRYNLGVRFQRHLWGFLGRTFHFRCTLPCPMLGNTGNGELSCQIISRRTWLWYNIGERFQRRMGFSGSGFLCLVYSTVHRAWKYRKFWVGHSISLLLSCLQGEICSLPV